MNIVELLKHSIFGFGEPDGAYSFEHVLNSGLLLEIGESPAKSMPEIKLQAVKGRDAYWIAKGTDYLVPLVCFYVALLHRCGLANSPESYPEIEFHPGLTELVTGLSEHECRRLVEDMELIYKLQVRITQDFYHRQVALMSEEKCKELIKEIESIGF
jgi:hypothetical protein